MESFKIHPSLKEITIHDIAINLMNICRYQGNRGKYFYSVLEHSLLVADVAREIYNNSFVEFVALLHDAPEAVTGDFNGVIKKLIARETDILKKIERELEDFFVLKFLPKRLHGYYRRYRGDVWRMVELCDHYVIHRELNHPLIYPYRVVDAAEDFYSVGFPDLDIDIEIGKHSPSEYYYHEFIARFEKLYDLLEHYYQKSTKIRVQDEVV